MNKSRNMALCECSRFTNCQVFEQADRALPAAIHAHICAAHCCGHAESTTAISNIIYSLTLG
jgi:hypothetical protein